MNCRSVWLKTGVVDIVRDNEDFGRIVSQGSFETVGRLNGKHQPHIQYAYLPEIVGISVFAPLICGCLKYMGRGTHG